MFTEISQSYYHLTGNIVADIEEITGKVRRTGICIIPDFRSAGYCSEMRIRIDDLIAEENAKIWRDPLDADNRIMGVEAFEARAGLRSDPLVCGAINDLYRGEPLFGFTMAGRIRYKAGNLGSGQGWHRDSSHAQQFKAILYLSDVGEADGPFEYAMKTFSERSMRAAQKIYGITVSNTRITDQQAALLCQNRIVRVTGMAGTLVIANTSGIHRGMPIQSDSRYALTLYSWPHPIPAHIAAFVNVN